MDKEVWKEIKDFEGYEVSNFGNVRSVDRIKIRKNGVPITIKGQIISQVEKYGKSTIPRKYVTITKDGNVTTRLVHRLVAQAFIPNPNNYPQVNHKDENPLNNRVDNLEWCTNYYNHHYGTNIERTAKSLQKRVACYTKDGFYKEYDSIKQASKELGLDNSSLTKVCKGKYKQTKGYSAKYL